MEILNALPVAIIALDASGNVVFVNSDAEPLLGQSQSVLLSKPFAITLPKNSPLLDFIHQAIERNQPVKHYDHTLTLKTGTYRCHIHITPSLNASGDLDKVFIMIDTPEMYGKFSTLQEGQQISRSTGLMAAMLAHEIKNPLLSIRGSAQLLQTLVSPEDQKFSKLICSEVDRIKNLINQIEFFADAPIAYANDVNIHEIIAKAKVIANERAGNKITFIDHYDPSLPYLTANTDLLIQMFLNLFSNALESKVKEKITITITTSYRSFFRLTVGSLASQVDLPIHILVQDDGPGIPEEIRKDIFTPFVTGKKTGKGLGLAIVSKIASDHGGLVELSSSSAQGAAFQILLPLKPPMS